MFGQNDPAASQPQTTNDDVVNAAMPDPVPSDAATTMQPPTGWGLNSDTTTATSDPVVNLDTTAAEVEAAEEVAEAAEAATAAPPSEPPVTSVSEPAATAPTFTPPTTPTDNNSPDLNGLKQEVMQHLSPLVGQLEQSPEEKFRTTMMMIQATDNHTLIKDAFEAAKLIVDDKSRAQALLDVINEINYFSQQTGGGQDNPTS